MVVVPVLSQQHWGTGAVAVPRLSTHTLPQDSDESQRVSSSGGFTERSCASTERGFRGKGVSPSTAFASPRVRIPPRPWTSRPDTSKQNRTAQDRPCSARPPSSDRGWSRPGSQLQEAPEADAQYHVRRRYFTKTMGGKDIFGITPTLNHFDVRMPAPTADGNTDDLLRLYYCDFLVPGPPPPPPPIPVDECTTDVERICAFLTDALPLTRLDAYPLLALTRDMLRRFVSRDLTIIDNQARDRTQEIERLHRDSEQLAAQLAAARAELAAAAEALRRADSLEADLEASRRALTAAEARGAALQHQVEVLNQHLDDQRVALLKKADERVHEMKIKVETLWHDNAKYLKREVDTARAETKEARASIQDLQSKLAAAVAAAAAAGARAPGAPGFDPSLPPWRAVPLLPADELLPLLRELLVDPRLLPRVYVDTRLLVAQPGDEGTPAAAAAAARSESAAFLREVGMASTAAEAASAAHAAYRRLSPAGRWDLFRMVVSWHRHQAQRAEGSDRAPGQARFVSAAPSAGGGGSDDDDSESPSMAAAAAVAAGGGGTVLKAVTLLALSGGAAAAAVFECLMPSGAPGPPSAAQSPFGAITPAGAAAAAGGGGGLGAGYLGFGDRLSFDASFGP